MSTPLLLIATALDTTWRVFLPTLGGTFAGIGLDKLYHTVPWLTLTGVLGGATLSGYLIYRQLLGVRKER